MVEMTYLEPDADHPVGQAFVGARLVLLDVQHNHPARCDLALVKAIARGRVWFDELVSGRAH